MPLLDQENFNKVVEVGKKAVVAFKEGNYSDFEKYSEEAWSRFPEPRGNWNQSYNIAKSFFKQNLELNKLDKVKVWLHRMIETNDTLHHFDNEVLFYKGLYNFELRNYKQAYDDWQVVVKDAGYRYFENEKPEFINFYRNPDKYLNDEK